MPIYGYVKEGITKSFKYRDKGIWCIAVKYPNKKWEILQYFSENYKSGYQYWARFKKDII